VGSIRANWCKKCVVNKRTGDGQRANVFLNFGLVGEVWHPLLTTSDFLYVFQAAENDVLHTCFHGSVRLLLAKIRLVRRWGENGRCHQKRAV
jgi:hypothetical protein